MTAALIGLTILVVGLISLVNKNIKTIKKLEYENEKKAVQLGNARIPLRELVRKITRR